MIKCIIDIKAFRIIWKEATWDLVQWQTLVLGIFLLDYTGNVRLQWTHVTNRISFIFSKNTVQITFTLQSRFSKCIDLNYLESVLVVRKCEKFKVRYSLKYCP
jgi:hypothetical protein